ncbi:MULTISPECIES: hypothetical protein [unclassified Streptomyces]|uniref:hypothetical protein n=1 Tax=unclassified Streptomyces TaxID=2593676 RepID=UPI00081B5221|nr:MULTISPECIES: hypothetical protein [unclassified Streptomyces]MYQ51136.1 hypothetical protein [Streptomyces sp. SID4941]SCD54775.1 hypothetical protein GA0115247_107849 [Streptomyces sp. PalvLS-984]SDD90673.1 hypothetical protein F558DRAFT_05125 [Streptomyces sp. AmelKG-A3]
MSRPEHRHDDDRTGNDIVNHGPDSTPKTDPEQTADGRGEGESHTGGPAAGTESDAEGVDPEGVDPESADADGSAAGGSAGGPSAGGVPAGGVPAGGTGDADVTVADVTVAGVNVADVDDADLDEMALRRMLHGAVQGIRPADGTLDHLHRAVPARRAKRRQAVVGAVAAALLIGTAVPAFVHVANSDGSVTANPAIAGHGEQAQGGNGQNTGTETDGRETAGPAAQQNEGVEGETGRSATPTQGSGTGTEGTGTAGLDDTPGVQAADMPACEPGQLGVASAEAGAPGSDGKVYGSFKISNVSGKACSVTSNGTVGFQAAGAADPQKISVVRYAGGDPASGLPDPSKEPGAVLLKPTTAYEVRFAWVPSDTCTSTGGSPSPTPTDGDGGGGSGGTTGGGGTGPSDTAAQFGSADDAPADGSVVVTHTPETGAPTAEATISHACAGTIYRTGVLSAS